MGLLPDIARNLLPSLYGRSAADAVAKAGWMISVYALASSSAPHDRGAHRPGCRVSNWSRPSALFIVGTIASALAPTFGLVLVARFVAALPHGAYFGAAGLLAARSWAPATRPGFAVVLSGLTAANLVGVPPLPAGPDQRMAGRLPGDRRIFVLTLIAVLATVPEVTADVTGSPNAELAALRTPQVWLVAAIAALGFAGFFAVDSYIAPVTTDVAGLPSSAVPWVLVASGSA